MLHHHGGAGSPYYAAPATTDAVQFSLPPPPTGPVSFTSIPSPETQPQPAGTTAAFAELPLAGSGGVAANLQDDDDMMTAEFGGTGAAGASGSGGSNRWPREETVALIRIRSEMDAAFRNAPLKAPLWEDAARKLAALGYVRSAKKCREKFENVDKYYRRTKEGRAGRQDGKSYRFFSELEALHAAAPQRQQQQAAAQADPQPSAAMPWGTAAPGALLAPPGAGLLGLSFSSLSGSDSESGDEFEFDDKGDGDASECDREMMALCDGMIGQVTEKLDEMQRVFLDTLEKWDVERTAREEAWRRQELARMNRECEQLAKERAAAASRDAALIAFLQRVGGGQSGLRLPPPPSSVSVPTPMPDRASPSPRQDAATTSLQVVPVPPKPEEAWAGGDGISGSTPSRWPKEEVQALIHLRTEKDEQYHDTGSKRPLWEDIAAGMRRIGYNRSAKRCKEKWENINKYFKKVKESNKRRPEDSKTCPYFHQLDAMYRKKRFAGRPGGSGTAAGTHVTVVTASSGQARPSQRELEGKTSNDFGIDKQTIIGVADVHLLPGNSETAPATISKAQDTARETNVQQQEFVADEMECNYTDEGKDRDRDRDRMQYSKMGSSGNTSAPTETAAAATSSAPASTTFLAVQ